MRKLALVLALLMINACSITLDNSFKIYADKYCSKNELGRAVLRDHINQAIAPHEAKINCEGDVLSD